MMPLIPQFEAIENPETLCANWRRGCNGVTDGAIGGRLTLCDDCAQAKATTWTCPDCQRVNIAGKECACAKISP